MLKDLYGKLKYSFSKKKLKTEWFIERLPKQITNRNEAESLMNILQLLDKEFTTEEFILYTKYENKKKRENLSKQLESIIDSYLNYNMEMTLKMDKLTDYLNENNVFLQDETFSKLCDFGIKNIEKIKTTVNTYRNLISHITYY